MDKYLSMSALLKAEREGVDFRIVEINVPAAKAIVIAPHGGAIEPRTSQIALSIAAGSFSYYAFEGIKPANNYRDLHVTSHHFDEPRALRLVQRHRWVLAIHGFADKAPRVLLGGRDENLIQDLAFELQNNGIKAETEGHPFRASEAHNICNRGASGAGVQIELSMPFRTGAKIESFVSAVASVLRKRSDAQGDQGTR